MQSDSKESIQDIIDTHKQRLLLCRYILNDPDFTKIDRTVCVTCRIDKQGKGALIQLN